MNGYVARQTACVSSLCVAFAAQAADELKAYAGKNGGSVQQTSVLYDPAPATTVSASTVGTSSEQGNSSASASRTLIQAQSDGEGTHNIGVGSYVAMGTSANARTIFSYALWDKTHDRALTFAEASSIVLSFTFSVTGTLKVGQTGLSSAGVNYGVTLYSDGADQKYNELSVIYGPMPAPPGQIFYQDFGRYGDTSLEGSFSRSFQVIHANWPTGRVEAGIAVGADNVASSSETMWLSSVDAVSGVPAGLALGLVQYGATAENREFIIGVGVSPVPELPTWAMFFAGACIAPVLGKRKRGAGSAGIGGTH